jgi:hypothetical protein
MVWVREVYLLRRWTLEVDEVVGISGGVHGLKTCGFTVKPTPK